MSRPPSMMAVVAPSILLFAVSCSFTLDTIDERAPSDKRPSCDTNPGVAVLDSMAALGLGLLSTEAFRSCGGVDGLAGGHEDSCDPESEAAAESRNLGYTLLAPAVIYALAATYGYYQTSRCRGAIRVHRGRTPHGAGGT